VIRKRGDVRAPGLKHRGTASVPVRRIEQPVPGAKPWEGLRPLVLHRVRFGGMFTAVKVLLWRTQKSNSVLKKCAAEVDYAMGGG